MSGKTAFWSGIDKSSKDWQTYIYELKYTFNKGFSVVMLARGLRHKTAARVYKDLRESGAIGRLSQKRHRQFSRLAPGVEKAIKNMDLSYVQWCNSHGEDPGCVEWFLSTAIDRTEEKSVVLHNMFALDFPRDYRCIFGETKGLPPEVPFVPWNKIQPEISTSYNGSIRLFEARCTEYPEIIGFGDSPLIAHYDYKRRYVLKWAAVALRGMIRPPKPFFRSIYDDM